MVEVRNDWRHPPASGGGGGAANGTDAVNGDKVHGVQKQPHHSSGFFGSSKCNEGAPSVDNKDPILATVTVPLSSVNIEEEDDDCNGDDASSPATAATIDKERKKRWKKKDKERR